MMALGSLVSFGQADSLSPYHNIQINEKVHFLGDSATSCYVVIQDLSINSLSQLSAYYRINIYKSKVNYETNNTWNLPVTEIPGGIFIQFTADFTQGDLWTKVSEALKSYLLTLNPTWQAEHIVIE